MASIGFLIGGALINALAFSSSNFLFSSLSKESIDKERKRHDKAIEDLQRAQIEWAKKRQEQLDYINNEIIKEHKAEKRFSDLNMVVHEIDHMSDLHVDSSFYRQSMKIDNYFKITEWIDSAIGQARVLQQLDKRRPKLSNSNQTQNRRRHINFENGSHFICNLNLNKRSYGPYT